MREARQPVRAGHARPALRLDGELDARERPTVPQRVRPRHEPAPVGEGVEADLGGLHPRLDAVVRAVGVDLHGRVPVLHRLDAHVDLPEAVRERGREVDGSLGELAGRGRQLDDPVEDEPARRHGLGRRLVGRAAGIARRLIGPEFLPVFRPDLVERDFQPAVVDAVDGVGAPARRVEDDEALIGRVERRGRGIDLERELVVARERLPVNVAEGAFERDRVGGVGPLRAVNHYRVVSRADVRARQLRRHADVRRLEAALIERVAQQEVEGVLRRAAHLVAAGDLTDAEGAVGLEGEALVCRRRARAFGRGRAGRDDDPDGRVRGQRVLRRAVRGDGTRDDPAARRRALDQLTHLRVRGDLLGRGRAQPQEARRRLDPHAFEDARGVHALVELDEEQRVARPALPARVRALECRRRSGELEGPAFGQRVAVRRLGAGRDADRVVRRHREAPALGLGLEHERLRTEPAPAARGLRREADGDVRGGLRLRGDGDHRLREGDAQGGRQLHRPLGRGAQDFERRRRSTRGGRWRSRAGRGERRLDGAARARRRERALAELEARDVVVLALDGGQAGEKTFGLRCGQGFGRRDRGGAGPLGRGARLAQAEAQARLGRGFILRRRGARRGRREG